ncbi:radial spoke head 1 homolog [Scaptodrosophila lebanonensis]|uniref:Radial spoke head 1 homolog n=1 Tax=Drosophila lebanonensis TaxID=7225 RepID=A0A6J2U7J3_DROLE|nr:radial spoke head 1 homolog [Scaptodrosophila lebanonensis]
MSVSEFSEESDLSFPDEEDEGPNIGLYIGGRNAASQRHGRGWAILPNGDQYDGNYRKGRRHGIGLYVFKGGARYYGQYRCGKRCGRGIFIYPDGSVYEGNWRKHLKHGKGRYNYVNGDTYSGDWYKGMRHGVGIYSFNTNIDNCCLTVRLKSTWNSNVRMGPFELYIGNDDKCIILHGIWDTLFPVGPAVFSFDNRYLLLGYFLSPNQNISAVRAAEEFGEELQAEGEDEEGNILPLQPTLWFAQEIAVYDYSLLPQEPVPLPISDSELSVCSLSTVPSIRSEERISYYGEGEEVEGEEGEMECFPCECEYSLSEVESDSEPCKIDASPCAIEILKQPECPET